MQAFPDHTSVPRGLVTPRGYSKVVKEIDGERRRRERGPRRRRAAAAAV